MDPSTKDELHLVEVEGQDLEGQKIKAALAALKPSTLPSVSKRLQFNQFLYWHEGRNVAKASKYKINSCGSLMM